MPSSVLRPGDFSQVDQASNPASYADYLGNVTGVAPDKTVKRRKFGVLRLQPGNAVLDIGCGLGQDVLALARLVGPLGRVVGIDRSVQLLEQARARAAADAPDLPVTFEVADAHQLPFADATFDACHSERVLQHLADPQQAVREMARVLRPEGRLALVDTDWETFIVDHPDRELTRTIAHHWCDQIANPWAGRQLNRLVASARFVDITVEPLTLVVTAADFPLADKLTLRPMAALALADGVITQQQATQWLTQIEQAVRDGTYFWSVTKFLVSARHA